LPKALKYPIIFSMANLHEYPQSGNLVEREPISKELEEKYQAAKNAPLNPKDGFSKITPDELYDLGKRILNAKDVWRAYDILAETSASGLPYYDLVIGCQHLRPTYILFMAIEKLIPQPIEIGLDIGAGTGISTLALVEGKCQKIITIDLNPKLLAWAKRKWTGITISLGDAIALCFPPNSFDIVIAQGLDPYLTLEEIQKFYQEVWRVLKPKGSFFKYLADLPPNHPVYSTSPRAELAGVVAKALLSFTYAPFYQVQRNFNPYEGLHFERKTLRVSGSPYNERILRLIKEG